MLDSQVGGCTMRCWSEQADRDVLVPIPSNQCGPQGWEVGVLTRGKGVRAEDGSVLATVLRL